MYVENPYDPIDPVELYYMNGSEYDSDQNWK